MPPLNDATRPMRRRFGPYTCTHLLGMSYNSAVYVALHESSGEMVALRVMTVLQRDTEAAIAECLEELATFAAIDNPYIVPILDYGNDKMVIYIATRLMKGASLADRLKQRGAIDTLPAPAEIVAMGHTLAEALDYIHEINMIHGQVEPRNILFDEAGTAYLTDIGLTRLLKIIYSLDASNSFTTSPYSAPELWDGQRPQPATDLYAIACIMYQLFTGKVPFVANNIFDMMNQHRNEVAMPPHYIRQELPTDLAMVFWRALAKPPENRYTTVSDFVDDLEKTFAGLEHPATDFFYV